MCARRTAHSRVEADGFRERLKLTSEQKRWRCTECGSKPLQDNGVRVTPDASPASSSTVTVTLRDATGEDRIEVTGESFHRSTHLQIHGSKVGHERCQVVLLRDADNTHDENAIEVKVIEQGGIAGRQLGFVNAADAREIAERLDNWGGAVVCNASLFRNDPAHVWSVELEVDLAELGI